MTALPPAPDGGANPGTGPTPDQAAWIRDHAWTPAMRKTHREVPAFFRTCDCQYGLTSWCQHDQHDRCHRAPPLRSVETYICDTTGTTPLAFAAPYEHRTDTSATGPQFTSLAQVWLADRVCRWVCPCTCHTAPPEPGPPLQLDLFGAAA